MANRDDRKGLVRAGDLPFLKNKMDTLTPKANHPPPIPPDPPTQMSLFGQFLANTDAERESLSNVIDFWDCIPRYSVSQQAMNKARSQDRFLPNYTAQFQYQGRTYTCMITPARVEDDDGTVRDYYPVSYTHLDVYKRQL